MLMLLGMAYSSPAHHERLNHGSIGGNHREQGKISQSQIRPLSCAGAGLFLSPPNE
jgi:hypothetical protein